MATAERWVCEVAASQVKPMATIYYVIFIRKRLCTSLKNLISNLLEPYDIFWVRRRCSNVWFTLKNLQVEVIFSPRWKLRVWRLVIWTLDPRVKSNVKWTRHKTMLKVERNRVKGQKYHIHQIRTVRAAQGWRRICYWGRPWTALCSLCTKRTFPPLLAPLSPAILRHLDCNFTDGIVSAYHHHNFILR